MKYRQKLIAAAGNVENKKELVTRYQTDKDIIKLILTKSVESQPQYAKIFQAIRDLGIPLKDLPKFLFDFCRTELSYAEESPLSQTVSTPAVFLRDQYVDCKHYSLFIGGVLAAANDFLGKEYFPVYFRFASYKSTKTPHHVFIVLKYPDYVVYIDPCFSKFNEKSNEPNFFIDKPVPMALYSLSGVGVGNTPLPTIPKQVVTVTYDRKLKSEKCIGNVSTDIAPDVQPVSEIMFVSPLTIPQSPIPQVLPSVQTTFNQWDSTPDGGKPIGGNNHFIMGPNRRGYAPTINGVRYSEYETYVRGVHYMLDGKPYIFPPAGSKAPVPQGLFQVEYPATFDGRNIPASLPKPVFVGNRLVMAPVPQGYDAFWGNFLARVIYPLAMSHAVSGWYANYAWQHQVNDNFIKNQFWDYISGMPYYLPGVEYAPTGVLYYADKKATTPLAFPKPRNFYNFDEQKAIAPPQIPDGLTVVYPATYRGFTVPSWLPKPVMNNGRLEILPKRIAGHYERELEANNFLWLTFLTGVMMPLVSSFCEHPYNTSGNELARRILYDTDTANIQDYLTMPDKQRTWFGRAIENVVGVVRKIGSIALTVVAAPARAAFVGLVRINFAGFATNLQKNLQGDKRSSVIGDWKQIGGTEGDLLDAVNDGAQKNAILGSYKNIDAIGVEPGTTAAALIAAATPIIAALATWLKGQVPEAGQAIDLAINRLNMELSEAGLDPISVGNVFNRSITVEDPNNPGQGFEIPPAPIQVPGGSGIFTAKNVLIGSGVLLAGYFLLSGKGNKRN